LLAQLIGIDLVFVSPGRILILQERGLPMKNTDKPLSSAETRNSHAASELTPVIDLIRSMRFGSYPDWITLPGAVRSVPENRCPRSTRESVPRDCGSAEDEIFSSVRVQAPDKLSQVAAHRHCFAPVPEFQKKYRLDGQGELGAKEGTRLAGFLKTVENPDNVFRFLYFTAG